MLTPETDQTYWKNCMPNIKYTHNKIQKTVVVGFSIEHVPFSSAVQKNKTPLIKVSRPFEKFHHPQ